MKYAPGFLELAGTVADNDRNDYRLVTVFLGEGCLRLLDEYIVELCLHKVDGAAAEAAAHDA